MDTVIRCEGLSKSYKDINALKNLNLEIKENLIVGFLGVNGAGKATIYCRLKLGWRCVSYPGPCKCFLG